MPNPNRIHRVHLGRNQARKVANTSIGAKSKTMNRSFPIKQQEVRDKKTPVNPQIKGFEMDKVCNDPCRAICSALNRVTSYLRDQLSIHTNRAAFVRINWRAIQLLFASSVGKTTVSYRLSTLGGERFSQRRLIIGKRVQIAERLKRRVHLGKFFRTDNPGRHKLE
jgi:hypothetical protein